MRVRSLLVSSTILPMLALASAIATDDPFVGTWKLNVEKSKFNSGRAPKSRVDRIEIIENGYKETTDAVDSEGKAVHRELIVITDGKDHPVTDNPGADTYMVTRSAPNTLVLVMKKAGKKRSQTRREVSRDGKTMKQKGRNILYFEKQ